MIFRQSNIEETDPILREGYKVWHKDRTYEKYRAENVKEDAYGTRYVIEDNEQVVCSLILLELKSIDGKKAYGIGSVLTPPDHKHKGYATKLLGNCIRLINIREAMIFLYSEVAPAFYERFGFRTLPPDLQKETDSICMVLCGDDMWHVLIQSGIACIPGHF